MLIVENREIRENRVKIGQADETFDSVGVRAGGSSGKKEKRDDPHEGQLMMSYIKVFIFVCSNSFFLS